MSVHRLSDKVIASVGLCAAVFAVFAVCNTTPQIELHKLQLSARLQQSSKVMYVPHPRALGRHTVEHHHHHHHLKSSGIDNALPVQGLLPTASWLNAPRPVVVLMSTVILLPLAFLARQLNHILTLRSTSLNSLCSSQLLPCQLETNPTSIPWQIPSREHVSQHRFTLVDSSNAMSGLSFPSISSPPSDGTKYSSSSKGIVQLADVGQVKRRRLVARWLSQPYHTVFCSNGSSLYGDAGSNSHGGRSRDLWLAAKQSDDVSPDSPQGDGTKQLTKDAAVLNEMEQRLPPAVRRAWKQALKQLSSLPLALWEMAVIAALSALGTFIEQGRPDDFYVAKYTQEVLGLPVSEIILKLGFDHMYTAPIFLFLCAMLSASLAACTSTRQLPMARIAKKWKYIRSVPMYRAMPYARQVKKDLQTLSKALQAKGFEVNVQDGALYASKGLFSRFAPIGVHASLLMIIAGATVGGLSGARGSIMVPDGQAFVVGPALTRPGPLFGGFLPDTVINVNSFRVEYNDAGAVDQFYSDLSVLEGLDPSKPGQETETLRETIYVNKPLQYQGLTVYQSDWDIVGLKVSARPVPQDGTPLGPADLENARVYRMVQLPGKGRTWGTYVPLPNQPPPLPGQRPKGITMLAADFQQVILYDSAGQFAGVRIPESGRPIVVEGVELVVGKMLGATGLELKSDPGVPLVYAGFAACLVTSIMSLWPYRQVWAVQPDDGPLVIGGRTNRDEVGFEQSLDELLGDMK